jgi:hypothetical protein
MHNNEYDLEYENYLKEKAYISAEFDYLYQHWLEGEAKPINKVEMRLELKQEEICRNV